MLLRCILFVTICCVAVTTLGRAADPFPADTDFVRKAEQACSQEIGDARLAITKSNDPIIRGVAKRMQDDGTAETQRLAALAVEKGWPTAALDPNDTWSRYSDHRYVLRQIRAQQNAIALYTEEAANGADTKLQELARNTLPTLRRRLESLRLLRTS
jgi:putative membrane protein